MKTFRLMKGVPGWVCVLTAATLSAWPGSAWSQADVNLPPRQDTKSATGVSFKSGSFTLDGIADLSIGGDGIAGLHLVRSYSSSLSPAVADNTNAQGWTFNTVGLLSRNRLTFAPDTEPPPDPTRVRLVYTVSTGSKTVSFLGGSQTVPSGPHTPISPGGETLVFTQVGNGSQGSGSFFTFTDSVGSVYVFPWTATPRVQSVTYPDGTRLDYTYVTAPTSNRVTKSVISNRGYAILFDGQTKACIVNLAETHVTATSSCPPGVQSVEYSYTTSTFNPGVRNLTGATNALNQTTRYEYIGADHLGCVKEPGQTICKIDNLYNVCIPRPENADNPPPNLRYSDQVTSQVTGTGESYSYTYQFRLNCDDFTGYGELTTMVAPGNAITKVATNGSGMPGSITDPLNRTVSMGYFGNSLVEWEQALPQHQTEPEGNSQHVVRDSRANITERRSKPKPGTGLPELLVTAGYPATCVTPKTCNKPEYVIDAKGNRTDYTYDPNHGGILTETGPPDDRGIRPQKRYSYTQLFAWIKNSSGALVQAATPVWMLTGTSECMIQTNCVGTADEIRTEIQYGTPGTPNNLLPTEVKVSSGDGALVSITTTTYDSIGNALTVDGPLPGSADTTRYRYDALRRIVGVIGPDPDGAEPLRHRATRNTYDPAGRLIKVERGTVDSQSDADWAAFVALEAVETQYDVMGRKLKETQSGAGRVNAITQYSYDASGRLDCIAVRMDPAQWSSQTNACVPQTNGPFGPDRVTKHIYDLAGQLRKKQVAVGTIDQADEETYTYTTNGNTETVLDGENNLTTYEYDGFDRLRKTRYPVGTQGAQTSSTTDFEQLGYDENGNITQRRLRDGQLIGFGYDNLNRPKLKDLPAPEADVSYLYDLQNRPLAATQGSASVSRVYDALGRLRTETTAHGAMAYRYDEAGRRTRTTWPDGFFVTQDFLVTGETWTIRESGATSGVGVLATYSYDTLGRRRSVTRGNGTITNFEYDFASRLRGLAHDVAGSAQDVSSTFDYNPASQIVQWTRNNPAYAWTAHRNQNKSFVINGLNQLTTGGGVSFGHDRRGNLTSQGTGTYGYTAENRLISAPNGVVFSYDPLGRLSQSSGSGGVTRFHYDDTDLVAEYNSSNQLLRRYVHGPGVDEPVVWYEGTGTSNRRWLHADERGSVVAVSDGTGAPIAINSYDEFGIPGSGNLGRFQYTGQTWLPDVGMFHYKARVYSPSLGRFLQTDPVGYSDGVNLYAYVGNDPLNHTDPSGQVIDVVADIGFIAYDVYHLATEPSWIGVGALSLDVAGAFIPFVTGAGQAYRTASTLHRIAKQADRVATAGKSARAAGVAKHAKAAELTRNGFPNAKVEQPFKAGQEIAVRSKGSSVPDVVTQTRGGLQPFDFKFGKQGTSDARNASNKANVGTVRETIDIKSGEPPQGRANGFGAACTLANEALSAGPCSGQ